MPFNHMRLCDYGEIGRMLSWMRSRAIKEDIPRELWMTSNQLSLHPRKHSSITVRSRNRLPLHHAFVFHPFHELPWLQYARSKLY